MEIFEIKDGLYQSTAFSTDDVPALRKMKLGLVVDLLGSFDPQILDIDSFLFWPISDAPWMPDTDYLWSISRFAKEIWTRKKKVLVHCGAGINRSSLVNGCILFLSGMQGADAVDLIRKQRPGALSNFVFAHFLEELKQPGT